MAEDSFSFPFRSYVLVSSARWVKVCFSFPLRDCILVSLTSSLYYHMYRAIALRFVYPVGEKPQLFQQLCGVQHS